MAFEAAPANTHIFRSLSTSEPFLRQSDIWPCHWSWLLHLSVSDNMSQQQMTEPCLHSDIWPCHWSLLLHLSLSDNMSTSSVTVWQHEYLICHCLTTYAWQRFLFWLWDLWQSAIGQSWSLVCQDCHFQGLQPCSPYFSFTTILTFSAQCAATILLGFDHFPVPRISPLQQLEICTVGVFIFQTNCHIMSMNHWWNS